MSWPATDRVDPASQEFVRRNRRVRPSRVGAQNSPSRSVSERESLRHRWMQIVPG